MSFVNEFTELNDFNSRVSSCKILLAKYNEKIPIIVLLPNDVKCSGKSFVKYLVSGELNFAYVLQIIRKKITLNHKQSIFMFTENGTLLNGTSLINYIYQKNKNCDGYMYIRLQVENTFGFPNAPKNS